MRISNPMITSRMMININRNTLQVNKYFTQISTGKKIQYASEDPIVAARALKFRTNVKETQQYQKNVTQGISWMEITEQGFINVDEIMTKVHELVNNGATDTLTMEDRQKVMKNISSLVEQLGHEMNITYAGRYVFSGYRTDKPPILTASTNKSYEITQNFSLKDVENTFSYAKQPNKVPEISKIKILKLPYNNVDGTGGAIPTITIDGVPITVNRLSENDTNAYDPTSPNINYIEETGELVLSSGVYDLLANNDMEITYVKSGLEKGDLNPEVYFTCVDITDPTNPINYNMDGHNIEYEFGVNTRIPVNSLAKNVYTDKMYSDLKSFIELVEKVKLSDAETLKQSGMSDEDIKIQLIEEEQVIKGLLQDRFSDMIQILGNHAKVVSSERADLGSRMSRLELIENRLKEDELTYTTLMSENEDADYMEAIMYLQNAQSIYQASLQMGAKIIQTTLSDFIR